MNFLELVRANRSCRRYDSSKKVSEEQLLRLVEMARLSPCGANRQALRFAVVCDEKRNSEIFENLAWAGYLKDWDGPVESERPTGYIVFGYSDEFGKPMPEDVGIASQTIGLGARSEEMATCIFKAYKEEPIKEILGMKKEDGIVLVISVGYPVEDVVIDDIVIGEDIKYYRDENEVHHVPKIVKEDLLIK